MRKLLTNSQCRQIAERYLQSIEDADEPLRIIDESSIFRQNAVAFHFDACAFLDDDDEDARLMGNGAIIVDRSTGKVHRGGTAQPTEYYLDRLSTPSSGTS